MKSYTDLLNEYLFWQPKRSRYWQRYKDRWWRLCGTYTYKGKREEVLARYDARRKKYGMRTFERLLGQKNYLLDLIEKDTVWEGGNLFVPFKT